MVSMIWEPSPYDIAWTTSLLASIKDGGMWGIPATGSTYRIDHQQKVLVLVVDPGTPESAEMHLMIGIVARKMGWTVQIP